MIRALAIVFFAITSLASGATAIHSATEGQSAMAFLYAALTGLNLYAFLRRLT